MAKPIKIEIDEKGDATVDVAGFEAKGCHPSAGRVSSGVRQVTQAAKKPEYNRGFLSSTSNGRNLVFVDSNGSALMAKRILSISYDPSLLWTRQLMLQLGYVVSAEGFVAATEACEPNCNFDLLILGHTVAVKDKERIISHFRQHCDAPILALLRPHEGAMQSADRSIDPEPEKLIAAVREMLST